ncbi:MAG: TIGR01459 family HAD-type hydrolase [Rickettsiales bacterium]|nr:MAG: TIGR01459 family HAD-type hydrolase [Rickettsiales bacterium]
MDINNNLLQIRDNFDIFLFDAFGVFFNGTTFYEGVLDVMERLVLEGKIVYILSNNDGNSQSGIESYGRRGLIKGKHYLEYISAGEVAKYHLNEGITFKTKQDVKNVYITDDENKQILEGSKYKIVDNLKEADFIILSDMPFNIEEYEQLKNEYGKVLFELKEGVYRSTIISPYKQKLDILLQAKIPFLNPNPDYNATLGIKDGSRQPLLTPGGLAKYLKENGAEVIEFGKPELNTYQFAFNLLEKNGVKLDKNRICMIGDTLRTDIKGANNAGIKGILCTETGITAALINEGEILENLIAVEKVNVDYFIKSVSGY